MLGGQQLTDRDLRQRRRNRRRLKRKVKRTLPALAALAGVVALLTVGTVAYTHRTTTPTPTGPTPKPFSTETSQLATVFMGDSITQANTPTFDGGSGSGSWVSMATPDPRSPWLEQANVAVGGQDTGQMLARFKHDVIARHPEAVVILAGANDAGRLPPDVTAENLRQMVALARGDGERVWLISAPPSDVNTVAVAATVAAEARVADELDVPFLNLFETLGEAGRWPRGWTVDGTHPTPKGARAIARAALDRFGSS